MNTIYAEQASKYLKRRKQKRIALVVVTLAVLVTGYMLIKPAVTLDKTVYCGHKEHVAHTEEAGCYEVNKELTCGLEEGEGHQHSDACYKEEKKLVCGHEDGEEGHQHTDSCYKVEKVLVCDKEESDGHQHVDSCYTETKEFVCEMELHEHTLACYSNKEADLETKDEWEHTLKDVKLSGDWSKDVVAIAKTQEGYKESEANYEVEGKDEKQGYTRYGQWYGQKYGDWSGVFGSFVMHYSAIMDTVIPYEADVEKWIEKLKKVDKEEKREYTLYHDLKENYLPKEGDLVFLDVDKEDKVTADHVGFISDVNREKGEMKAIIGDSLGAVKTAELKLDSDLLVGYMEMPENPDASATPERVVDGEQVKEESEAAEETDETKVEELNKITAKKSVKKKLLGAGGTYEDPGSYLTGGASDLNLNATWDSTNKTINTGFTVQKTGGNKDTVSLMYNLFGTWVTLSSRATGGTFTNDKVINSIDLQWKVTVKGKKGSAEYGPFNVYDILESIKPGFDNWLRANYRQDFGATKLPENITELYDAFDLYLGLPTISLTRATDQKSVTATVKNSSGQNITTSMNYKWYYEDEDGELHLISGQTGSTLNVTAVSALEEGGTVLCKAYNSSGELRAVSEKQFVNPKQAEFDAALAEINSALVAAGIDSSLAVNGTKFKDNFYYRNVANDKDLPFYDAETYAYYLEKTCINEGVSKAVSEYKKYLYDLYDPNYAKLSNIANTPYPIKTYGDDMLEWPKDEATSFHSNTGGVTSGNMVQQLDFNYIDQNKGFDYKNFIKDVEKTVTADAAGDSNTNRSYDVEVKTEAQAKINAPVALLLQIQTSWQNFNLEHANALVGEGYTEKGTAAMNAASANLYDTKQALLRLVDYMEENYAGKALVLGISEVKHGGSTIMLNNGGYYVSNNYDALREAIYNWDTFGNCEHVHYDTRSLEKMLNSLSSNLSLWRDYSNQLIDYNKIDKAAVIIGGVTENSSGKNGYGCILPWSTFRTNKVDAVYALQLNKGSALNQDGMTSWLDNPSNNSGAPYTVDGTGNNFTKRFTTTNEDAIYDALVSIVETEMNKKTLQTIDDANVYAENGKLKDIVSAEFEIDYTKPIKLVEHKASSGGTVTTTLYDPATGKSNMRIDLLHITENADGTTTVECDVAKLYNRADYTLEFGIVAKEDYIGSNNVFSNEGLANVSFGYKDKDGVSMEKKVDAYETPEVNVPVKVTAENGGETSVLVNTPVNLEELDAEDIIAKVKDSLDKYKQTNGTLSYEWVMPDGSISPISITNHVTDGKPDTKLPTKDDLAKEFTPDAVGTYTPQLKVTFTPDKVKDNGNFADDTTKTAVTAKSGTGIVTVKATSAEDKMDMEINKYWSPEEPSSINSIGVKIKTSDGKYLNYSGGTYSIGTTAQTFTLTKADGWHLELKDVPGKYNGSKVTYSVEENKTGDLTLYNTKYSNTSKIITVPASGLGGGGSTGRPSYGDASDGKITLYGNYTYNQSTPLTLTTASIDGKDRELTVAMRLKWAVGSTELYVDTGLKELTPGYHKIEGILDSTNVRFDLPPIVDLYRGYYDDSGTFKIYGSKLNDDSSGDLTVSNMFFHSSDCVKLDIKNTSTSDLVLCQNNSTMSVKVTYQGNSMYNDYCFYSEPIVIAPGNTYTIYLPLTKNELPAKPVDTGAYKTFRIMYTTLSNNNTNTVIDGYTSTNGNYEITTTIVDGDFSDGGGGSGSGGSGEDVKKAVPIMNITNIYQTSKLTLSKYITEGDITQEFEFTLTMMDDDKVFPDSQPTNVTLSDGGKTATVNLANNQRVAINIPQGSKVKIEETGEHSGYYPIFKNNERLLSDDDSVELTVDQDMKVDCINTAGVELPNSGGNLPMIYLLGILFLIGAMVCGISMRRRAERGVK